MLRDASISDITRALTQANCVSIVCLKYPKADTAIIFYRYNKVDRFCGDSACRRIFYKLQFGVVAGVRLHSSWREQLSLRAAGSVPLLTTLDLVRTGLGDYRADPQRDGLPCGISMISIALLKQEKALLLVFLLLGFGDRHKAFC